MELVVIPEIIQSKNPLYPEKAGFIYPHGQLMCTWQAKPLFL